jgi:cystathionine beta-lyase
VFAGICPEFAEASTTLTAPSKTFNVAGLLHANVMIPDPRRRARFRETFERSGLGHAGPMGLDACRAAYSECDAWVDALVDYLHGTMALIGRTLEADVPGIRLVQPEGTYLAWLDCREMGLAPAELGRWMEDRARLWLDPGTKFGAEGAGYQRVNTAFPRSVIGEALGRLAGAAGSSAR